MLENIPYGTENGIKETNNSLQGTYRYTWRSIEVFEGIELSKTEKDLVYRTIKDSSSSLPLNNIKNLIELGLCGIDGRLSKNGTVYAIQLLSLKEQCQLLKIPLQELNINKTGKVEFNAKKHFQEEGYSCSFCEGGIIHLLLYIVCFDFLFPFHVKKYKDESSIISYSRQLMSFLPFFIDYEEEIIESINNMDLEKVSHNYDKILNMQVNKSWELWKWYDINKTFAEKVYLGLGNEQFKKIAKVLFRDPYAYCKGWPDITVVKNNSVKLLEIKKNDTLHRSQIITLSDMMKDTGLEICVIKV